MSDFALSIVRNCGGYPNQVSGKLVKGTQSQVLENIFSEDDLIPRIFGTFVVKFLACLPLLGFSNI